MIPYANAYRRARVQAKVREKMPHAMLVDDAAGALSYVRRPGFVFAYRLAYAQLHSRMGCRYAVPTANTAEIPAMFAWVEEQPSGEGAVLEVRTSVHSRMHMRICVCACACVHGVARGARTDAWHRSALMRWARARV